MASVCDDLGTWHSGHVATAHYELGELSLRRGDLTAAAGAFAYCRELGHTPLPGMASSELASGHVDTAVALVRAELATTRKPLLRSRRLSGGVGFPHPMTRPSLGCCWLWPRSPRRG